jgi:cell division protein FtsB
MARPHVQIESLRAEVARLNAEIDRLRAENKRLRAELEACFVFTPAVLGR